VCNKGAPRQKEMLEWSRMRWQRMSANSARECHSEPRKILIKMVEQSFNSSECKTPFSLNLSAPPGVRDDDTCCVCVRSSDRARLAAMQHSPSSAADPKALHVDGSFVLGERLCEDVCRHVFGRAVYHSDLFISVTSGLDVSLNQRVKYRFACGTCSGVPSYKV
jgi:hypothetical protein